MEKPLPGDTTGLSVCPFAGETLYSCNVVPLWDSASRIQFESPLPILGPTRARLCNAPPASFADHAAAAICTHRSGLRERQLVPIRVVQMEVSFAPTRVPRPCGIETPCLKVGPELINVLDMKDQPSPAAAAGPLLEVQNRILRTGTSKRTK